MANVQHAGRLGLRRVDEAIAGERTVAVAVWALILIGTIVRVAIGAATDGLAFERQSYEMVRNALNVHPLHVYALVNHPTIHYPYPPGYLLWIWLAGAISPPGWHPFRSIVAIPAVVADGALAWIIQHELGRRGAGARTRVAATALVALSPSFGVISGYQGQIDAVAILPAMLAVISWVRLEGNPHRALLCGLLIGIGGTIKTVPLLAALALLPSVRSWREAAVLAGSAAAVMLAALAPFYLADHHAFDSMSKYGGIPGLGGLTLAIQPDLARVWLVGAVKPSGATLWVVHHQKVVNGILAAGVAGFLWRTRPDPVRAAAFVWIAIWALGTGFFFQYLIWGLPFLILAGWLRAALALQLAVLAPTLIYFSGPWRSDGAVVVFVCVMLAIWAAWVAALAILGTSFWRARASRLAVS